jgi:hypothetical protein
MTNFQLAPLILGVAVLLGAAGAASACEGNSFASSDIAGSGLSSSIEADVGCQTSSVFMRGEDGSFDVEVLRPYTDTRAYAAGGGHDVEVRALRAGKTAMVFSGLCSYRGESVVDLADRQSTEVVVVPCE